MSLLLDFSSAPVPDRRYSADAAWTVIGSDMVRILFAQYKAAGPKIEHLVVVRVPFVAVRGFLHSMTSVAKTGHTLLERMNDKAPPEVDKINLPDQTFTLDANIFAAGLSGREACVDLYNSSPQVKVAIQQGSNEFRAEPVARILLATRVLMDVHDELASAEKSFPNDGSEIEVIDA